MSLDTLAAPCRHEIEVKRSRFLALGVALATPDEVAAQLGAAADPTAHHLCWAWRFGEAYRSSDAGEPSGTAGRPILSAIDGQGFDRVLVMVLRWFGGTKLGAGGLVRAYGGCAAECLRRASRQPLVERRVVAIACDFAHADLVHRLVAANAGAILSTRFDADGAHLRVELPALAIEALRKALDDATRGRARLTIIETQ